METSMVLHKEIVFMRFYFIFVIFFAFATFSHAERRQNNVTIKSLIIKEIMKRVSNITLNSLSKAPPEKKEIILNKIEDKLKQSATVMGPDANKYVKFIMDEFKVKAFTKEKKNVSHVIRKSIDLRANEKARSRTSIDTETKQEIIKDIAVKIESLAKRFMKNAKTIEKKKEIMENIKKRIMDSAKQKHIQIHNKHEELKAYSSLIAEGLNVSMTKILADETDARRQEIAYTKILDTEVEPLSEEIVPSEDIKAKNDSEVKEELAKDNMIVIDIQEIDKYKNLISETLNDTSLDPRCDEVVEETCLNIQSFNKISCGDGKSVPIESLCNGVIDCWNQIDEGNCTTQAMEKVRKANDVMSEIEASLNRKCFALTDGGHILTSQNQVLRDVLQTQMEFLQKHIQAPPIDTEYKGPDDIFIRKTVNDVNIILSTLSYALDGTLCAHHIDPDTGNKAARKFDFVIDDLDEEPRDPNWSPKSCICNAQFCKNPNCDAPCKRVCWQKYSLSHWACQAINGGTSVSVDVLCDGKLDCFDETDESNCALGAKFSKFEAHSTYSNLLDLLSTKSKSLEFTKTRNKLVALYDLVRQLQKYTIKINTDTHTIKLLRDESFNLLASIYEDLMQTAGLEELDYLYLILLTINEKLVTALKSSHTGNENIISPEGCYCRDGLCALHRCTKNCIQACLAEPILTRFPCNTNNISVPIETICNGKNNCPNGEDEKDCIKEVCRGHHIVMLRHKLQDVGIKHKSTVLGEVLESWKAKVSAALFIAESTERPNHKIMIDIITQVLHDLVMAYAAMEDYRRMHSGSALQEFVEISKIVMHTLKTCTYRWVPACLRQRSIPPGALRVGTDVDGDEIYAGRAPHEGDILPAKVIPTKNACYVCYGGKEIVKDQFEVLVPAMFSWQFSTGGAVPPGAVDAGVTADGEKLYFGRVTHDGATTPGKIHPSHGTCYYPFDGEERSSAEYEVLVLM